MNTVGAFSGGFVKSTDFYNSMSSVYCKKAAEILDTHKLSLTLTLDLVAIRYFCRSLKIWKKESTLDLVAGGYASPLLEIQKEEWQKLNRMRFTRRHWSCMNVLQSGIVEIELGRPEEALKWVRRLAMEWAATPRYCCEDRDFYGLNRRRLDLARNTIEKLNKVVLALIAQGGDQNTVLDVLDLSEDRDRKRNSFLDKPHDYDEENPYRTVTTIRIMCFLVKVLMEGGDMENAKQIVEDMMKAIATGRTSCGRFVDGNRKTNGLVVEVVAFCARVCVGSNQKIRSEFCRTIKKFLPRNVFKCFSQVVFKCGEDAIDTFMEEIGKTEEHFSQVEFPFAEIAGTLAVMGYTGESRQIVEKIKQPTNQYKALFGLGMIAIRKNDMKQAEEIISLLKKNSEISGYFLALLQCEMVACCRIKPEITETLPQEVRFYTYLRIADNGRSLQEVAAVRDAIKEFCQLPDEILRIVAEYSKNRILHLNHLPETFIFS